MKPTDPPIALPRAPVLDWVSFKKLSSSEVHSVPPSVEELSHIEFTTSGQAAIFQALLQFRLPPQSTVLVPTYHCPTMVAPVLLAGLRPAYFGLLGNGLPDLASIAPDTARSAKAMVVAHYFGLPQSLSEVRQWCDVHGILMIEDCAHCYFGQAGERPVGCWGDFAIASLTKFFPVPEAGLLGSAHRSIKPIAFTRAGWRAQLKGCFNVMEFAAQHRRLAGLRLLLAALFWLKNRRHTVRVDRPNAAQEMTADLLLQECDMNRITHAPLWVSMKLKNVLPRERIVVRRRENFALFAEHLGDASGARPLITSLDAGAVPYVYPLWVDDAERVYIALKALGLPVFRWNRVWPGTPSLPDDAGHLWSRHVLQLLCHQDLSAADVAYIAETTLRVLRSSSSTGTDAAAH